MENNYNARLNSGNVTHKISIYKREDGDIHHTLCGSRSTGYYTEKFFKTNSEVSCKKCLKLLTEKTK